MIEVPLTLPFQEPVLIVSQDQAGKPEIKAHAAELGLDMVISRLVPPGTAYVYNPMAGGQP